MLASWRADYDWLGTSFWVVYWLEPEEHDDSTVYVGKTGNLAARLMKHRRKPWWSEVVYGRYFWFPCQHEVWCDSYQRERMALGWEAWGIKYLNPTGNIARPVSPI